jgi:putative addiction module killer protein
MIEIRQTAHYSSWFASLKDRATRARIAIGIRKLSLGNSGKSKSVGGGVSEFKFDFGPGWRVYYLERGKELVVLLGGGNKSSQADDIDAAKKLAQTLRENE